ncbi:hypothetical protein AVEN_243684-1 [Araneus ventricosus]|uniref:Uncharacterized protein n=1 Tax=Araneus ventricosus TaxID=182803 RepID=A0A4Y2A633_ARAVE|nr:hypothetical protein AVEN_243684-1 [Araneus ventricosus]
MICCLDRSRSFDQKTPRRFQFEPSSNSCKSKLLQENRRRMRCTSPRFACEIGGWIVVECDFERFETLPLEPVINEIVSLAKIMGLEEGNNYIDELVEEHRARS